MRQFHICTISNRLDEYRAMKTSFLAAGFDEGRCRYTLLDNSAGNRHEPYSAINEALRETTEPYLIFCHQDIRLDRGDGYEELTRVIDALEERDPSWAVVGNAGGTETLLVVTRVTDPTGETNYGAFPEKVQTLDENFLLLKTGASLCTSEGLSGFHLYGTDLCLQAIRQQHTCYAVDFHLTHLSAGDFEGGAFQVALEQFCRHWDSWFTLRLVKTTGAFFSLSRYSALRTAFRSKVVQEWVIRHRGIYIRLCRLGRMLKREDTRQGQVVFRANQTTP